MADRVASRHVTRKGKYNCRKHFDSDHYVVEDWVKTGHPESGRGEAGRKRGRRQGGVARAEDVSLSRHQEHRQGDGNMVELL